MRRVALTVAAVVALLAPAGVAEASPVHTFTLDATSTQVFPVADGYLDSTDIYGSVDAGAPSQRIRASISIAVRGRVITTIPIRTSGSFHVVWNGRAGNGTIVPGVATVTLRLDGQHSSPDTVTVSAKKLVKVNRVSTQTPWISMNCRDDRSETIPDSQESIRYLGKICPTPRDARQNVLRLTLRGSVSDGPVVYDGFQDATGPAAIDRSPIPPVTSITATFTQSGSGSNGFWLCVDSNCDPPASSTLQTFSTSGTYRSLGTALSASYPSWRVVVQPGHDLSFSKITIRTTYWTLV